MTLGREIWFDWDGVRLKAVHPRGLTFRVVLFGVMMAELLVGWMIGKAHPTMANLGIWALIATLFAGLAVGARHSRRSPP
jgi:quinol-cytochrome oxidoreductase complex cytochrome b subunit